jgi:hypothetical protein
MIVHQKDVAKWVNAIVVKDGLEKIVHNKLVIMSVSITVSARVMVFVNAMKDFMEKIVLLDNVLINAAVMVIVILEI